MNLDGEDPAILEQFVKFLYNGDFSANMSSTLRIESTGNVFQGPSPVENNDHSTTSISAFKFEKTGKIQPVPRGSESYFLTLRRFNSFFR